MPTPLISLDNVTIGYPGIPILEKVSVDIFPGDSYAVLGPNGSGKTALLKTIGGILSPIEGRLDRLPMEGNDSLRVGYVPQRATINGLLPLTVREVIQMGTYGNVKPWQRLGKREQERINWAKQEVEIEDLEQKRYSELSGGQQQRTLIARALASAPGVLVLDEPLASLDKKTVQTMLRLLVKLKSDTGMTLLWADHLIPELLQVVQDVLEIEYRTVQVQTVETYIRRGESSVVDS
jgi:zinc transport system ATP-binding protein